MIEKNEKKITNKSNASFQDGDNVRLTTLVLWVLFEFPSTVTTANGSGRRKTSRLMRP